MDNPDELIGVLEGSTMTEVNNSDQIPDPDISDPNTHPHTFWPLDTTMPEPYHTDTHPISFKLEPEEIALYENNPTKLVGRMYLPGKGENLWEVTEVSYRNTGWSTVEVEEEGSRARHKMLLEDFFRMLKQGVLQGVEF